MKRLLLFMCIILCSNLLILAQSYQEVIYLKNGSIIKGVVIEQTPNVSIKIKTADSSVFAYQMSEVEKITKEETSFNQKNNYQSQFNKSNVFDKKGYRGFVELGGAFGFGDFGDGLITVSTSHGYQFNPYFYLGAGLGAEYHFDWETAFIPIYADARAYFVNGNISPYFGLKIGYSVLTVQAYISTQVLE